MLRILRHRWKFCLVAAATLVALAGCGRYFFAERESWRREAEIACLKSGVIKESQVLVRVEPINGPGMCGADFPLKVAALGESTMLGYSGELRPPASVPGGAQSSPSPRWPGTDARYANPYRGQSAAVSSAPLGPPMQLNAPGAGPAYAPASGHDLAPPRNMAPAPNIAAPNVAAPSAAAPRRRSIFDPPPEPANVADDEDEFAIEREPSAQSPSQPPSNAGIYHPPAQPQQRYQQQPYNVPMRSGPMTTGSVTPVEIKPTATLACPIVSALDQWITAAVQPAALRWFGQPVTEIRQISAYSCRGMNGQRNARISEHAFGNALDIASFILADGRRVTVKGGWRGSPEEQGFLRDVQGAACQQFTTVLAPGSNRFHYDHIHVDLMRRRNGRSICNPDSIPGEVIAARVARERGYALQNDSWRSGVTGSIGKTKVAEERRKSKLAQDKSKLKNLFRPESDDEDDWVEDDGPRSRAD